MARKPPTPYIRFGFPGIRAIAALPAKQCSILLCLAEYVDANNQVLLTPDRRKAVAQILGISDKTFRNNLVALVSQHLLERSSPNDFFMNPEVFAHPDYKPADTEPTALYRHYSDEDELLYVGISKSAPARLAQHMHGSAWAREIARVDVEHPASRQAALAAEEAAIKIERPLWNRVHNGERTIETSEL